MIFFTFVAVDMSMYLSPTSTTIPPMILPSVWEGQRAIIMYTHNNNDLGQGSQGTL